MHHVGHRHDGTKRMYMTPSNAGMSVVACNQALSKRIILSWGELCRRYSPAKSDQEAITLLETLPQFVAAGAFVRDTLTLGQYSRFARHFPGDKGKALHSPLPSERGYRRARLNMSVSGIYKYMSSHGDLLTRTEGWRTAAGEHGSPHDWYRGRFLRCPDMEHLAKLALPAALG